jgi:hypothetical protein
MSLFYCKFMANREWQKRDVGRKIVPSGLKPASLALWDAQ